MREIFGLILSGILALAYIILWGTMIVDVLVGDAIDVKYTHYYYLVASLVGGIGSALAVTILGATPRSEPLSIQYTFKSVGIPIDHDNLRSRLTFAYLLARVLIGLGATIVAFIPPIRPKCSYLLPSQAQATHRTRLFQ